MLRRMGDAVQKEVAQGKLGIGIVPVLMLAQQLLLQDGLCFVPLVFVLVSQVQGSCIAHPRFNQQLLCKKAWYAVLIISLLPSVTEKDQKFLPSLWGCFEQCHSMYRTGTIQDLPAARRHSGCLAEQQIALDESQDMTQAIAYQMKR